MSTAGTRRPPHTFTVYALDVDKIEGANGETTGASTVFMMRGHVLATGKITGVFGHVRVTNACHPEERSDEGPPCAAECLGSPRRTGVPYASIRACFAALRPPGAKRRDDRCALQRTGRAHWYAPTMKRTVPTNLVSPRCAPDCRRHFSPRRARRHSTRRTGCIRCPFATPARARRDPDTAKIFHVPNSAIGYTIRQINNTLRSAGLASGDAHETAGDCRARTKACDLRVWLLPSAGRPRTSRERDARRIAGEVHRPADDGHRVRRATLGVVKALAADGAHETDGRELDGGEMKQAAAYFAKQKLRYVRASSKAPPCQRIRHGPLLRKIPAPTSTPSATDHRVRERSRAPREARCRRGLRRICAAREHRARARARDEVTKANPKPCVSCHGEILRGAKLVPPIAGRSPTYLMRQLLAFKADAIFQGGRADARSGREADSRRHDCRGRVRRVAQAGGFLSNRGPRRYPR